MEKTVELLEGLVKREAGAAGVRAMCLASLARGGGAPGLEGLVILERFPWGLRLAEKKFGGRPLSALYVDRRLFEEDVSRAALGEVAALHVFLPFEAAAGGEYLLEQEAKLKARIAEETLRNLVLEYSHLAREILIKPEYFLYDALQRRVKAYPLLKQRITNALGGLSPEKSAPLMMRGFHEALVRLQERGVVELLDGLIRAGEGFVAKNVNRSFPPTDALKAFRESLQLHVRLGFSSFILNPFNFAKEALRLGFPWFAEGGLSLQLPDPKQFLILPTSAGFLPLSDETSIEDFVRREAAAGRRLLGMRKVGGVLNQVYLLSFSEGGAERKVVAKKFEEWSDFKWATLAFWTLGAQNFSVRAKVRMAKECLANRLLRRGGVKVPEILHVSWEKRLLFLKFVEGETLDKVVARMLSAGSGSGDEGRVAGLAGETLAKAHRAGVAVGDYKPENLILSPPGEIYVVDLEQASKGGNMPWDVAEFLYYSAHYAAFPKSRRAVSALVKSFVEGYRAAGGPDEVLLEACNPQYVKIFAPFVMPQTLFEVARRYAREARQKAR